MLRRGAAGVVGDITGQLLGNGHVDWSEVGVSILVGGAMGGIDATAGAMRSGGSRGAAVELGGGDPAAQSRVNPPAAAEERAARSPSGCHSSDPDTQVLMADGRKAPIMDVKVGDKVRATGASTD